MSRDGKYKTCPEVAKDSDHSQFNLEPFKERKKAREEIDRERERGVVGGQGRRPDGNGKKRKKVGERGC